MIGERKKEYEFTQQESHLQYIFHAKMLLSRASPRIVIDVHIKPIQTQQRD